MGFWSWRTAKHTKRTARIARGIARDTHAMAVHSGAVPSPEEVHERALERREELREGVKTRKAEIRAISERGKLQRAEIRAHRENKRRDRQADG